MNHFLNKEAIKHSDRISMTDIFNIWESLQSKAEKHAETPKSYKSDLKL